MSTPQLDRERDWAKAQIILNRVYGPIRAPLPVIENTTIANTPPAASTPPTSFLEEPATPTHHSTGYSSNHPANNLMTPRSPPATGRLSNNNGYTLEKPISGLGLPAPTKRESFFYAWRYKREKTTPGAGKKYDSKKQEKPKDVYLIPELKEASVSQRKPICNEDYSLKELIVGLGLPLTTKREGVPVYAWRYMLSKGAYPSGWK